MPVDEDAEVLLATRLSDDYTLLSLRAPAIGAAIEPGQFVMVRTAAGMTPLLRRPYSVFERLRGPAGDVVGFSILNKRVGAGSLLLSEVVPGSRFSCLGPLGRPFSSPPAGAEAWMVAGGTGLAPFATLSERLSASGVACRLFYGARTGSELFCVDLFEPLGIGVFLATEDGTRGDRGRVTSPLERELEARRDQTPVMVYACGPEPMLEAVAALAARHRCACEVATERQMGCGMGGCYSCVVQVRTAAGGSRYARSCVEGPVFDAASVVWPDRRG